MKRNLAVRNLQVPLGVRFMSQPTGGDGSAADTGAGSNPPAGDTSGSAGAGEASGDDGSGQGGEQSSSSSDGQEDTAETRGDDLSSFPEAAQAMIKELRRENGNHRTAKKAAEDAASGAGDQAKNELVQELGKTLGLIDTGDDGAKTPSAEELTQSITSEQEAHKATKVELAVYRSASKHQADPDALLDSRSFLAEATKLDPSSDEFGTKITEAIKSAVNQNPKLKLAGQAPGRSGGQVNGGGSVSEGTSSDLASRIRKARNY